MEATDCNVKKIKLLLIQTSKSDSDSPWEDNLASKSESRISEEDEAEEHVERKTSCLWQ